MTLSVGEMLSLLQLVNEINLISCTNLLIYIYIYIYIARHGVLNDNVSSTA